MSIDTQCEILYTRNYGFADFQDKNRVNFCSLNTLCTGRTEVFRAFKLRILASYPDCKLNC